MSNSDSCSKRELPLKDWEKSWIITFRLYSNLRGHTAEGKPQRGKSKLKMHQKTPLLIMAGELIYKSFTVIPNAPPAWFPPPSVTQKPHKPTESEECHFPLEIPSWFQGGSKSSCTARANMIALKKGDKEFCSFWSIQGCSQTAPGSHRTGSVCATGSEHFFQSLYRFVKWTGVIKGQLKTQTAPELRVRFSLTHFRHQEGWLIAFSKAAHLFALCV